METALERGNWSSKQVVDERADGRLGRHVEDCEDIFPDPQASVPLQSPLSSLVCRLFPDTSTVIIVIQAQSAAVSGRLRGRRVRAILKCVAPDSKSTGTSAVHPAYSAQAAAMMAYVRVIPGCSVNRPPSLELLADTKIGSTVATQINSLQTCVLIIILRSISINLIANFIAKWNSSLLE